MNQVDIIAGQHFLQCLFFGRKDCELRRAAMSGDILRDGLRHVVAAPSEDGEVASSASAARDERHDGKAEADRRQQAVEFAARELAPPQASQ
jgi:hypothetical protein